MFFIDWIVEEDKVYIIGLVGGGFVKSILNLL